MSYPAMYGQQMKGTLMPGQAIAVNKYTVQVERFLSQGGFAHVYLVRTAEPVFNTTHHVLKRIAVANEAMLNDVKKEVDIMRILRGHPNIVYLIDAAWHKMPNGMFEVFILMEFCSGGGIIDMMNRRLRERLTESEILQIFCDVCEGVAAMHNLRPALLHRDLKVENILQASATSYKLCDFGSAMPVAPRPPSTTQEIKALEADLNKHTTLQYRAPEMVDVYQRRPVDEKSDVWALGVLLYKLCYYTTPFEEHGVLAILNVQYHFPPYPVYSQQLNGLIASMLREHNVHRPSVFDILETVHTMRGTKSLFTYNPPPPQPLSPRKPTDKPIPSLANQSKPSEVTSPPTNNLQTREKVLDAIAPMRRGRPSSPMKAPTISENAFSLIDANERGPWAGKPAKAHKSGMASISSAKSPPPQSLNDAWSLRGARIEKKPTDPVGTSSGFADAFDGKIMTSLPTDVRPALPRNSSSLRPPGSDAFESLNILPSPKPQTLTLGEAQKVAQTYTSASPSQSLKPSPSPSYKTPSPIPTGTKTGASQSSWSKSKAGEESMPAEQRFPSLEDLDAVSAGVISASGSASAPPAQQVSSPYPQLPARPNVRKDSSNSFYHASVASASGPNNSGVPQQSRTEGVRSQQVTGTAMRDARKLYGSSIIQSRPLAPSDKPQSSQYRPKSREKQQSPSRPMLTRKHRSSISMRQDARVGTPSPTESAIAGLPPASGPPTDWLTGDGVDAATGLLLDNAAKLRASPEKRASLLQSPGPPDVSRQASLREMSPSPSKRSSKVNHRPLQIGTKSSETSNELLAAKLNENWSPRSSSSSEGPEEPAGGLHRKNGVSGESARERVVRKGRQGSVHDLVDLWGGSGNSQPPKAKQEKRGSTLSTPVAANPRAPNPRSSPSPSRSKFTQATSPSKNGTPVTRKTSVIGRQTPLITPKPVVASKQAPPSPSPSAGRTRPQSMFLPVQKSVSESTPATASKPAGLIPPSGRPRMQSRRSSISDLVSHYEAIEGQNPNNVPPQSPLLSSTNLLSSNRTSRVGNIARPPSSTSLASPTAASTRFPRVTPTNSPRITTRTLGNSGLDIPSQTSPSKDNPPRRKASPVASIRSPSPVAYNAPISKSISQMKSQREEPTPSSPKISAPIASRPGPPSLTALLAKDAVNQESKQDARDPSPEKPYQGVGKLIAQWQNKTDGPDGPVNQAGQGSLKNANSRFRREGIQAGGNFN